MLPIASAESGTKDVKHSLEVKGGLEVFLADSVEFYSKLTSMVESQLSFKVAELLSNRLEFASKTHCRKVKEGRRGGSEEGNAGEVGVLLPWSVFWNKALHQGEWSLCHN